MVALGCEYLVEAFLVMHVPSERNVWTVLCVEGTGEEARRIWTPWRRWRRGPTPTPPRSPPSRYSFSGQAACSVVITTTITIHGYGWKPQNPNAIKSHHIISVLLTTTKTWFKLKEKKISDSTFTVS
jgi:hypothetical protein